MLIVQSFLRIAGHDFSSVQFSFPPSIAKRIKKWGKDNIADEDVFMEDDKYGREDDIHVTVKYGLHTADSRKADKVIREEGEFTVVTGKISRFVPKDKDYDVVKIEVESPELCSLHKLIGDNCENSDEHDTYRPHCTIAYVKKGCCAEISGSEDLSGIVFKVKELTFSSKTGEKTKISLR